MPGGTQYTNWHSTNPNNGNENHVLIRMADATPGDWGDWYGSAPRKYVCEAGLI